jgi:catechol 2,3-dioxygenase-like lactoylglutathione lyase family enzyme
MRRIALVTLVVDDYDEAIHFYTEALGFRLVEDTARPDGSRWVVVAPDTGGHGTGLPLARAEDRAQQGRFGDQTGGRVGFFLHSHDFARDHARMLAAGVTFPEEPRHEPYGSVVVFQDLYGKPLGPPPARPRPMNRHTARPTGAADRTTAHLAEKDRP